MIVCHCNVITCTQVKAAVADAMRRMPPSSVTPEHVYACCGTSPQCGGCRRIIGRIIESVTADLSESAA
jgi:bacterioferritin-associated ferredoxin